MTMSVMDTFEAIIKKRKYDTWARNFIADLDDSDFNFIFTMDACAEEILAVIKAAEDAAFYYGGDANSGPARNLIKSTETLKNKLTESLK